MIENNYEEKEYLDLRIKLESAGGREKKLLEIFITVLLKESLFSFRHLANNTFLIVELLLLMETGGMVQIINILQTPITFGK